MSDRNEADTSCCASCGIAGVDDIKLKKCTDCDLVRYCSDECQKKHKPKHEEACKKRAAELRDELLFKQPESSHLGDCPICMIPLPIDLSKSIMMNCCSKMICNGCSHANDLRIVGALKQCPFCRFEPSADKAVYKRRMERIKANDPVAMRQEGTENYHKENYISALKWFKKAVELGDVEAHGRLASLYHEGQGVEKNRVKTKYHMEQAAIGGHPIARHNLGCIECNLDGEVNGNIERAKRHLIIAAVQGYDLSMKMLLAMFKEGLVSKDDLAATLRAHQAAVDATKSPQRDAAEEYDQYSC
eukprot:scaffold12116_cov117-Skeletonema_marinoi.AAC.1